MTDKQKEKYLLSRPNPWKKLHGAWTSPKKFIALYEMSLEGAGTVTADLNMALEIDADVAKGP